MESDQIPQSKKGELKKIYLSLNPVQLKRAIEEKLNNLYKAYQEKKQGSAEVKTLKKLTPRLVRNYITEQYPIQLAT